MNAPTSELDAPAGLDLRLTWLQIGLLIALVLVGRLCALYSCPLYDDAFITFRYARNLAEGAGMVFNPGAPWEPILGTTTAGYTFLLSTLLKLGGEPTTTAIALDVVLDLISAGLLIALFKRRLIPATVTLVLFALMPQIARISVGGMESPLLVALLLSSALAWRANRAALTSLFIAIACTVRPEAVLFAVIFGLRFLLRDRKAFVRYVAVIGIVGIVAAGILTNFYGSPIPQSVQAKSATHAASDWLDGVGRMGEILQQAFLPSLWLFPLIPIALIGLFRSLRERDGMHLVGLAALAVVTSYLIARPHTWGWYYFLPLVAWTIWMGYGAEQVAASFFGPNTFEKIGQRARLGLPVLLVTLAAPAAWVSSNSPDLVTRNVYKPLQALVEREGFSGDVRVLASDIGAVGYYSDCLIIDSEGLTWPGALEYQGEGPGMMSAQIDILAAERPEYVLFVAEAPRLALFRGRADLVAAYEPIARLNLAGDTQLEPKLESLPPHWKQDYLVFRRRSQR